MKRSLTPFKLLIGGLVVAVAGTTTLAYAHGGRHHHGAGMGGPAAMMGSPERVDRMVDRMLSGIDATDAQRTQVKQIAQAAAVDLKSQREARRALREQTRQAFVAPTVDANAVEALRQQMLAQHDQMSRRMTTALLDISRVLTPEQRAKMAERMKARGERMKQRGERKHRGEPMKERPVR